MGCTAARPQQSVTNKAAQQSSGPHGSGPRGIRTAATGTGIPNVSDRGGSVGTTTTTARQSLDGRDSEGSLQRGASWVKDDLGFKQHLAKVNTFAQLERKYELGSLLGEGITGQVRLVTSKIDGNVYAMKSLNVWKMDESQLKELRGEIETLKHLDHPNVVALVEVFESEHNICLIMDYNSGGDLGDRQFRTENDVAAVLFQIVLAVAHCHHFGIIHRDLKLENIMFASKERDYLRLIDFGLSKTFFQKDETRSRNALEALNEKRRMMKTVCGTIVYMAPEILTKVYSEKADIWAIGIIAYVLFTGAPPFQGENDRETLQQVRAGEVVYNEKEWKRVSPKAKDFVRALLTADPEKRPSAQEALRMPWLRDFRQQQLKLHPINPTFGKEVFKSLIKFASYPLLRKAALMVISFHAKEDDKFELQRVFLSLDEDFSGELRVDHLYRLIELYGDTKRMPCDRFHTVFDMIDQDRTGVIHHMEFLAATIETVIKPSKRLLDQAFDHLDVDASGFISAGNLLDLFGKRYTEADVLEILKDSFHSLGMEPQPTINRTDFMKVMEKAGFHSEIVAKDQVSNLLNTNIVPTGVDAELSAREQLDEAKESPLPPGNTTTPQPEKAVDLDENIVEAEASSDQIAA